MNKNIFGFDIPMYNIIFLQKLKCNDHLYQLSPYNFIRQTFLMLKNKILKGTLIAILYKQKQRIRTFLASIYLSI